MTSPREEQMAAEDRAATAEAERDAAIEEAEQRAREAEAEAERAREEVERAAEQQTERERLAAELERIGASQSQFELYTDRGGKHRWRLRHQNSNIIADSAQGYSSRQNAQRGISSVRRDAFGASVVDLDKLEDEVEVDEVDDAVEGEEAPEFVEEVSSEAEFEAYEDKGGEYRWRLTHQNGNIIADGGQGYASKSGAEDAVERMTDYAPEAHVLGVGSAAFEIYEDAEGKWRWRLRHRNGQILADSGQGYSDRNGAEDGINSVKRNAPNADVAVAE